MSKLSLPRVSATHDCVLLYQTLRKQQTSLVLKIGSLERRIERYREIIEKTTADLIIKQTILDAYEQALTQAPPTDVKTKLKCDLAKSQVLVLQARLLRYSAIRLIQMEHRLQLALNAAEIVRTNLQELATHEAQLAAPAAAAATPLHPETSGEPVLPVNTPVPTRPAEAPASDKPKKHPLWYFRKNDPGPGNAANGPV